MERYTITCKSCGAERKIAIHLTAMGPRIDWLETPETLNHDIVSGRKRPDGNWGFQCACGNDDLMTQQELHYYSDLVAPKPQEIQQVIANTEIQEPNFKMAVA